MIQVLAFVTAKPGMRNMVLQPLQACLKQIRAEPGCVSYELKVDIADAGDFPHTKVGEDSFVVVEKWENLEALKIHSVAPHITDLRATIADFVANRVLHVLHDV
ncbi:putative quinol monooxygenase [Bradyrhizobium ottawaense]|uniref:putative quinol monooxygenase n=1 Tax=Bradyrhizobium ottawaense TaxID=931866 RepID=UPI00383987EA